MILIPLIASVLYLVGGQINKWARWLIGVPIFIISIINGHPWYSIFAIATYLVATNAFSYGEKMIWTKIFGKWVSMGLSGFMYGLASFIILGWTWGVVQAIIGLVSFLILKWLDDTDKLKNPWQELLRGLLGTIVYIGG